MKILVIGNNPMGHTSVARAGRFWSKTPKLVEVVAVKAGEYLTDAIDINGNRIPCDDGDDPPMVEVPSVNASTGKSSVRMVPDPERIGRKSYEALASDPRITIKQTDSVSEDAADAAVGAARGEVSRLSTENMELKARIAKLESGDVLKEALAELAEFRAMTEPAPAVVEKSPKKGASAKG